MNIQQEISRIKHIIKRHDYNWFVLGKASISKGELAALKAELNALERKAGEDIANQEKEKKDDLPPKTKDKPKDSFEFDDLFGENQ